MEEARLAALCEVAEAAWPDVAVARAELAAAITERLAVAEPPPITDALAIELRLAIGCARGDAAAIRHLERSYLDVVPLALASMKLPAATVEDVRAAVRDKLLLPDGDKRPRVLDYAGLGRLRGLVQVTAVRTALTILRKGARELPIAADDIAARLATPEADAELALIKEQYRAAFAAAFTAAVGGLARRDRNLLRLHFLGGVTLERLAAMYGVHRATVVRWLAAARAALFAATRDRMRAELGGGDELDDALALIQSRLDVSVGRLLASVEVSHAP